VSCRRLNRRARTRWIGDKRVQRAREREKGKKQGKARRSKEVRKRRVRGAHLVRALFGSILQLLVPLHQGRGGTTRRGCRHARGMSIVRSRPPRVSCRYLGRPPAAVLRRVLCPVALDPHLHLGEHAPVAGTSAGALWRRTLHSIRGRILRRRK
jgi:hypothetical protein